MTDIVITWMSRTLSVKPNTTLERFANWPKWPQTPRLLISPKRQYLYSSFGITDELAHIT